MIITREEIRHIIEMNIDCRIYFELKTYYHPITPALIMDDLKVNWDFHRIFKPTLEKLVDENPLVKITSLKTGEKIEKVTLNSTMKLDFKIDCGTAGEHQWVTFNKDRSEQIRLRTVKLTDLELLVYLTIGTFRDKNSLEAFPSQVLIADILKTQHSSISRAIEGLVEKGAIRKRTKHYTDEMGCKRRMNYYNYDISVYGLNTETGEIIEQEQSGRDYNA